MSFVKPSGISGLDNSHPLYANVERFYEFGQLNKELVTDTAITTTATYVNDADIGDCLEFDNSSDVVTETMPFSGGGKTVLVVHKTSGVWADGASDVGFLYLINAGHIVNLNLRNGIQYEAVFRGNYGTQITHLGGTAANQAAIDARRCFAATFSETGGVKFAEDGAIGTSTATTTTAFASTQNIALMSAIGATINYSRVGAIVLFNKVLSDAELISVTSNPYGLLGVPAPRAVLSVDGDNAVYAGQTGVLVDCDSVDTSPTVQSVALGGAALTITNWNNGDPIVSIPLHINLEHGVSHTLTVTDDTGAIVYSTPVLLSANPAWETYTLSEIPAGNEYSYYHEAITDLAYTSSVGDILFRTAAANHTTDGAWRDVFTANVTIDYKIWDATNETFTSVAQVEWVNGGAPPPSTTLSADSFSGGSLIEGTTRRINLSNAPSASGRAVSIGAGALTVVGEGADYVDVLIPNLRTFGDLTGQYNVSTTFTVVDGAESSTINGTILPLSGYEVGTITALEGIWGAPEVTGVAVSDRYYGPIISGADLSVGAVPVLPTEQVIPIQYQDLTDGQWKEGFIFTIPGSGGTVSVVFLKGVTRRVTRPVSRGVNNV